jgi:multidrug transporter EmrE-like cation transporter
MVNLSNLIVGVIFGFLAQVLTFFQLQGQLKFDWFKDHYWLTVLMGIPISILFMYSVKNMVLAFDGEMWPSRLIGFGIGAIVFTLLSWSIFNEPLTMKTYVCLFLSFMILIIQLFWK